MCFWLFSPTRKKVLISFVRLPFGTIVYVSGRNLLIKPIFIIVTDFLSIFAHFTVIITCFVNISVYFSLGYFTTRINWYGCLKASTITIVETPSDCSRMIAIDLNIKSQMEMREYTRQQLLFYDKINRKHFSLFEIASFSHTLCVVLSRKYRLWCVHNWNITDTHETNDKKMRQISISILPFEKFFLMHDLHGKIAIVFFASFTTFCSSFNFQISHIINMFAK